MAPSVLFPALMGFMSIGNRLEDEELSDVSEAELLWRLGEYTTAELYSAPYSVITEYDINFGAGNSIDRKRKYVDHDLYEEVMDGGLAKTGLEPEQIIARWLDHEHCEKCVVDGDNPVDLYYGGHRIALAWEHAGVLGILGKAGGTAKIKNYEAVIWPALVRCRKKVPRKAPPDLWCSPLLDDPDEHDLETLKVYRRLGVVDAGKRSKYETRYSYSGRPCSTCEHWEAKPTAELAPCSIVNGLVRETRHCDFYDPARSQR
jgi:hypothetical protein